MRQEDSATPYLIGAKRPFNPVQGLFPNLPLWIIPGCIFFNFILCYLNTNVFTISVPMIILCEIILVGMAMAYGCFQIDRLKLFWLIVLGAQAVLILILSFAREEFLMKPLRDMMIMSVFVILGLSSKSLNPVKMLFIMSSVMAVVALYEAFFVESFVKVFDIRQFYVEKGVLGEDYFTPLNLSASGMRPNQRFLIDIPGIHRISSVYLEPVSLGFFGFILGLFFLSIRNDIKRIVYILGLVFAYFFIWMSDARMAFGSLTLMIFLRPLMVRFDHRFAAAIFPAIFALCTVIYLTGALDTVGEGLGARVLDTMKRLATVDFYMLIGLTDSKLFTEDSAFAKLLFNQGFLGFLLYWLPPILFLRRLPDQAKIYLFGVSIFLSFGFMLSSAIFTIKTAALLWFLYGYLIVKYGDQVGKDDKTLRKLVDEPA
jgi:putative polymerase